MLLETTTELQQLFFLSMICCSCEAIALLMHTQLLVMQFLNCNIACVEHYITECCKYTISQVYSIVTIQCAYQQ
jgi:hypothetical protein